MKLLQTLDAPRYGRLMFVGDVHGCYDELVELLERLAPDDDDLVVSVGDMVMKGPAPARCLDLWRERRYLAVKGNNEIRLLDDARPILRLFARDNRDVLRRRELLRYIRSWPLVIDFPGPKLTVVHGGFLPQMDVTPEHIERRREDIPQLRWIHKESGIWRPVRKKKKKDDVLWSEKWRGDRFVIYGHTPLREAKFDKAALGLDTGCVYGGLLTAAVWENGRWRIETVKARRKYSD